MGEYYSGDETTLYCEKCGKPLQLDILQGSIVRICPKHQLNWRDEKKKKKESKRREPLPV